MSLVCPGQQRALLLGLLLSCGVINLGLSGPVFADTQEQAARAQVAELKRQIDAIEQRMMRRMIERDDIQAQLRKTEKQLGKLLRSLADVEAAIAADLPRLAELDKQRIALQGQVNTEQATMTREIKHLWALQQGGGLRIVFGDQSPDQLSRNLAYYKYLLEARQGSIERFKALLGQVAANAEAIRIAQDKLEQQHEQLKAQGRQAESLRAERLTTLTAIERALTSDDTRKEELEIDREQLQLLLKELTQTLAEVDIPSSYIPFTAVKGRLPAPVQGRATHRYGASKNIADMRWRGWLMPAPAGSHVKAIHHGRVVYADWLRGQGLLVIIDHGEGYLSLYGHNSTLQQEVGDWVSPGDTVATVGASGGASNPGVYFEIRHDGQPVNPEYWISH